MALGPSILSPTLACTGPLKLRHIWEDRRRRETEASTTRIIGCVQGDRTEEQLEFKWSSVEKLKSNCYFFSLLAHKSWAQRYVSAARIWLFPKGKLSSNTIWAFFIFLLVNVLRFNLYVNKRYTIKQYSQRKLTCITRTHNRILLALPIINSLKGLPLH